MNRIISLLLCLAIFCNTAFAVSPGMLAGMMGGASGGVLSKLLGVDSVTQTWSVAPSYLVLTQFTASASGNITEIRTTPRVNGNFKFGIYSDNGSNLPNVLLNSTGSTALTSGGVRTTAIASTAVISGSKYWLACNTDTNNSLGGEAPGAGVGYYKVLTYSSAFPSPLSGGTTYTDKILLAGYGA